MKPNILNAQRSNMFKPKKKRNKVLNIPCVNDPNTGFHPGLRPVEGEGEMGVWEL
ncbi:hypothetical protein Hanom_Chr09g00785111 [Helianthus anomalus]